jgi:hypothetical protein
LLAVGAGESVGVYARERASPCVAVCVDIE